MNRSCDESRIRELIQGLKPANEQLTPEFDDILDRPIRNPDRPPARRLHTAVAYCAVILLLTVLVVVLSPVDSRSHDERSNIADINMLDRALDSTQQPTPTDVNLDHLVAAVDDHFRHVHRDAPEIPSWPTYTDSLLAFHINPPLAEE